MPGDDNVRGEAQGPVRGEAQGHKGCGDMIRPERIFLLTQHPPNNVLDGADGSLHLAVCSTVTHGNLPMPYPKGLA